MKFSKEQLEKHIKTHSERSVDDSNAVNTINYFFKSDGKIITDFKSNDKWPNSDGKLELVPNPEISRKPTNNFFVQIKGTTIFDKLENGGIKYSLKSLAFPAFILNEVTLDPGLLIVVLNPNSRNGERIFYKYMSPLFLASIDFSKESATIEFSKEEEIFNTEESINEFANKLSNIADTHSFLHQLEVREYSKDDVIKVVNAHSKNISDAIQLGEILNETRENVSKRMFNELGRLCESVLILNGLKYSNPVNLRVAWEISLLSIKTKFLASFLQGIRYIGLRIPEEGQNERLMLKYYDFLWKIRELVYDQYSIRILENLEAFPRKPEEDENYNSIIAYAIDSVTTQTNPWRTSRYYVHKKHAFYIGRNRYFELSLQLAGKYATKYNRITAYTKIDISSNYSIQIGFEEANAAIWDNPSKIKVITNWRVSIDPTVLNKFSLLLGKEMKISSQFKEYNTLMDILTKTGLNLLDFADISAGYYELLMTKCFSTTNTKHLEGLINMLHTSFNEKSTIRGRNVVRYLLLRLREELLENISIINETDKRLNGTMRISSACSPFENNPVLYNLPKHENSLRDVMRAIGSSQTSKATPYLRIKQAIVKTGELYFSKEDILLNDSPQIIDNYNTSLRNWDIEQGMSIKEVDGDIYIDGYEKNTVSILRFLLELSKQGNDGQSALNNKFIKSISLEEIDDSKVVALSSAFVSSKVLIIYGAAGTGKTTLMDYLSQLMNGHGRSKLFLAKTHSALENLERRINTEARLSTFDIIDRYAYSKNIKTLDYDIIYIDECSTIDNRTMLNLLQKANGNSLFILAGDIYQIESIDFGNWFYYAKDILPNHAIVELTNTWRTNVESIKTLWNEVRFKGNLITEMLAIDGPFSTDISKDLLIPADKDEVVLCLNYDGKYGLNCINSYFQDANSQSQSFTWKEWTYKVGDHILFNKTKRFPQLYNNLKGIIVAIEKSENSLRFIIDIDTILTALDVRNGEIEILSYNEESTRIAIMVDDNSTGTTDEEREVARMRTIVPFQLAYAVSIHKAQGLEYNSIKIIIPSSNSESISHGIFYTAITRAKEKLKIYWSADTMKDIIASFYNEGKRHVSLDRIKYLVYNHHSD